MKIVIIGSGWYGLHCASLLQNNHQIIILEKKSQIFQGSSYYNQNRLHSGFHYPRSYQTRQLCLNGYEKFIKEYGKLTDIINNNIYALSTNSNIDYETYLHIYQYEKYKFEIVKNVEQIKNIQGDLIKVDERIINHNKVLNYFKNKLDKVEFKLNYEVNSIEKENNIIINDEITCDFLIDCSNGSLNLSKYFKLPDYIYENTISLLYIKNNIDTDFDCLTIMDGKNPSLFLRDIEKNQYSLTHVEYTPITQEKNIKLFDKFEIDDKFIMNIRNKMEESIKKYIINFDYIFKYDGYFTSYKIKNVNNDDNRKCNILHDNNIISVNCGKITGIFIFEEYLRKINLFT